MKPRECEHLVPNHTASNVHSNPDPLLPKTVSSHTIYEVSRLCSLLQPDCFPQPAPEDRQTDGGMNE